MTAVQESLLYPPTAPERQCSYPALLGLKIRASVDALTLEMHGDRYPGSDSRLIAQQARQEEDRLNLEIGRRQVEVVANFLAGVVAPCIGIEDGKSFS